MQAKETNRATEIDTALIKVFQLHQLQALKSIVTLVREMLVKKKAIFCSRLTSDVMN